MSQRALEGVKVVDFTHNIAGPYCTKLLSDYGAEVIKIELPGIGDVSRRIGPFPSDIPDSEKSGTFLFYNTNKKSVTLNLNSASGVVIAKELIKQADVVVESFVPGTMARFGLGYEDLKEINPLVIMTSISNFGQEGPYRDYKATEIVSTAMGGVMYMSGEDGREPYRHGAPITQHMAGQNGYLATVTALFCRGRTGIGQQVDVSIMEAVATSIPWAINQYTYQGTIFRGGARTRPIFGTDLWPAKNGFVGLSVIRSTDFDDVAAFLDIPELYEEKFQTAQGRREHNEELVRLVSNKLLEWEKEDFFNTAHSYRFMASMSQKPAELLENEQLMAREYFVEVDHPVAGALPYGQEILGLTHTPASIRNAAPLLGQHNVEIIVDRLGYSKQDLVGFRQAGIV